jgi:hypothetical protein
MFVIRKIRKHNKKKQRIIKLNEDNKVVYQYHGMANSMPKQMRQYFKDKEIVFSETEMVDVVQYVETELVNVWEKGN